MEERIDNKRKYLRWIFEALFIVLIYLAIFNLIQASKPRCEFSYDYCGIQYKLPLEKAWEILEDECIKLSACLNNKLNFFQIIAGHGYYCENEHIRSTFQDYVSYDDL